MESGIIGQQNMTCGAVRPCCCTKEPQIAEAQMAGVKSVSRHEEASTCGGSFVQRTTCPLINKKNAIRVVLFRPQVVLN